MILFIIGYATNSVTLTKKEKEELEYGGEIIRTFETNSVKKSVNLAQNFARQNNLRIVELNTTETTWTGTAVAIFQIR